MILPVAGNWKMAVIRAASQPLLPNSDLSQIRVSKVLAPKFVNNFVQK